MQRILFYFAVALATTFFAPAQAAVFERDWKVPGDGLLTYDDVNRREWLDFPLTRLIQFPGETVEERFQSVIAETVSGGLFEGFTLATRPEVVALARSAGIVPGATLDYATNAIPTGKLIDLLDSAIEFPATSNYRTTAGFLDDFYEANPPFPVSRRAAEFVVAPRDPPFHGVAGLRYTGEITSEYAIEFKAGVALYRLVPEPGSLLLLLSAISVCRFSDVVGRLRKSWGHSAFFGANKSFRPV